MRIALIVHDYHDHGGHARYVRELAHSFRDEHEVHVFASVWEESDPRGITFHYVPSIRWFALTGILSFILPATFLIGSGFDVIHSQGLCGFRHHVNTAHFIEKAWLEELRKRGVKRGLSWFLRWFLVVPLEKLSLSAKFSSKVIAISKKNKDDLVQYYKMSPSDIHVIYHGVDIEKFHPDKKSGIGLRIRKNLGIKDDEIAAIFVGNLQKGILPLLQAMVTINQLKLVVVSGSDPSKYVELSDKIGISDRISWVPKSRDVQNYFAACDLFVFPTVYEPFGMVIFEAMASGLPVLTSRSAGAAELVEDGQEGWLLDDPWDSSELARKIKDAISNPKNLLEVGKRARQKVTRYTWEYCASETLRLYGELKDPSKI
jgi:UDP-glucose:(heptosyl)LPS alpha-1,3-glucosyltransferase